MGNENGAPGGSNASDGSGNEGSFSSSDAGDPSNSNSDNTARDDVNAGSTSGGSVGAPDTGDAPSAPEPSAPETFTDVEPGSWYEPGVLFCQQKKIMRGIAGTTLFGAGQSLTRAQMAVMMWRYADPEAAASYLSDADNETGMDDVESRTWCTAAANWSVENKVINGFPQDDGTFAFEPDVSVTLDQFCTIIANFNHVGPNYGTASLTRFSDSESVPQWAARGLAWCADKGLVSGYDRGGGIFELCSTAKLSRERAATVFMRGYDVGVFDDGSAPLVSPCEDLGLSGYWFIRSASASSLSVALGTTGTSGGSNVELVGREAAARLTFQMATLPGKVGYQNPAGYYQVSSRSVTLPDYASGYFTYVTPSQIAPDATREDCINAFIDRAYDYIGTAYRWNYSMEPGVGVDCIGLVYQCLYATGMDLGEFNPYDHYATGADGWHSHDANNMWDYGDVLHLPLSMRQRGDVISWEGHVAIYLGNDMIIDAYGPVDVHSMWSRGVPRGVLRFYQ